MRPMMTILSIVLFVLGIRAQESPKPEQIDAFGRIGCDEMGARNQNFAVQISQTPGSRGLVIVHSSSGRRNPIYGQFRLILTNLSYSNAEDRVDFLIMNDSPELRWEFWKIPDGAEPPVHSGEKWFPPKPNLTKPFIYDYEDEIGECSTFVPRKFAELLNSNPGAHANIVIKKGREKGLIIRGFANGWIDELTNKYDVDRKRIKIFYARGDSYLTYAEFWFVPARKR